MYTKPFRHDSQRGFTLVEIAIVLVIIGLLLGGILKGQELINNAKVRAIADRQSSLKVAWFSFLDRFASLPGDYSQANIHITGASNGNGDGRLTQSESVLALQHLASAGYLRCPQCTETATDTMPTTQNSLVNNYGGVMSIWNDSNYYALRGSATNRSARLMIHTGPRIPSSIMGEVDRKIDDGIPNAGDMRYNDYDPVTSGGMLNLSTQCTKADETGSADGALSSSLVLHWRPANSNPPVWQDCGGSVFI